MPRPDNGCMTTYPRSSEAIMREIDEVSNASKIDPMDASTILSITADHLERDLLEILIKIRDTPEPSDLDADEQLIFTMILCTQSNYDLALPAIIRLAELDQEIADA